MCESIEDAIECWNEDYSFIEAAEVTGYDGGYPVVRFTINEAAKDLVKSPKHFKHIARRAEMEGGIEVGVCTCFYDTCHISYEFPYLTICGYPEVIQRVLKYIIGL